MLIHIIYDAHLLFHHIITSVMIFLLIWYCTSTNLNFAASFSRYWWPPPYTSNAYILCLCYVCHAHSHACNKCVKGWLFLFSPDLNILSIVSRYPMVLLDEWITSERLSPADFSTAPIYLRMIILFQVASHQIIWI